MPSFMYALHLYALHLWLLLCLFGVYFYRLKKPNMKILCSAVTPRKVN